MKFFDENNQIINLDDLTVELESEYFWVLDLMIMDYTLAPLTVLEELTCPTFVVEIGNKQFMLPASWNMLIYDVETSEVDLIPLCEMTGRSFTALGFGPNIAIAKPLPVRIVDYKPYVKNVSASLNKHQMLCHPIDEELWFTVCAADVYTKYIKKISLGDITQ